VLWVRNADYDYPYRLLVDALDLEGTASADKVRQVVKTAFEQKKMGLIQLPTTGAVKQLLPIANRVIAYTERSVFTLSATETGFDWTRMLEEVVAGRGCVCGYEDHHFFLARNGCFWKHSMNGERTNLDYQEFGIQLAGASVSASFDETNKQWLFPDGTNCVAFSEQAAFMLTKFPTSIIQYKGESAGIANTTASVEMELETVPTNFGFNGLKELRYVEVTSHGLSSARARIGWRQKTNATLAYLGWVPGSPEGTFWGGAAGTEFTIGLKGVLASTGKVEELNAGVMYTDARSVRGPRALGASADSPS